MSAGGDSAAGARGPTLFDALVSHERGDRSSMAPSLRPRLPYLFEDATRDTETDIEVLAMVAAAPTTSPHPAATPASPSRGGRDTPRLPALREPISVTVRHVAEPAGDRRQEDVEPATAESREGPPRSLRPQDEEAARPPHQQARPTPTPQAHPTTERASPRPRQAEDRRLPDEAAAALQTPPRVAALRRGATLTRDEPVIEISIGRIDIRAAVAPAVQAPQSAPAKPRGDRLAAYLERRTRGSRS
ncbi:hypothetical protein Nham_0829 [Nitrobacter hamburgensis X14]|uniref:Uncharacterized protein n=1 Tax=Nitrobacter hamburgensis (strain DSM 10229 / NCIMB 13809 / X14) TaxID=323097 RepID=Q1QPZ2_NITHX|nr:hypothetical protein [Nitrobacter hamburgensis]ABE61705.1 hypothetical protein Nham_0829 [Nitrobacter hamburgensis X14]